MGEYFIIVTPLADVDNGSEYEVIKVEPITDFKDTRYKNSHIFVVEYDFQLTFREVYNNFMSENLPTTTCEHVDDLLFETEEMANLFIQNSYNFELAKLNRKYGKVKI